MNRREWMRTAAGLWATTGMGARGQAPGIKINRPSVVSGVQSGDVDTSGNAIVWAQADRASRLLVEWSTTESLQNARKVQGSAATETTDFTARASLKGLPPGQTIFYRVRFGEGRNAGEPITGRLRTPSNGDVRFVWTADLAGQGWGINKEWGGYRIYETMRRREPQFFLNSGDNIYADGPIQAEVKLVDGSVWRNVTTEEKSKVAETLKEFRGNYRYNLLDENLQRFNAEVSQIWQWDDHEVLNNWYFEKDLTADNRYREKDMRKLVARAGQAFREYAPMRTGNIYRNLALGPLVEIFVIDLRSYRGPNTHNRQTVEGPETAWFGADQLRWLQGALKKSRATWKVIASDMPIGLLVGDGKDREGRAQFEASANGEGPPLGRELEVARLLRFLRSERIRNTVWLTADVHYCAAHEYRPERAKFTEFDPFWEFVAGPSNAGTFGPGVLDETFGPQVVFSKHPEKGTANLPPSAGLQFFGEINIDAKTKAMTISLRDVSGSELFRKELAAV
jgi:alkaline phosphatase D